MQYNKVLQGYKGKVHREPVVYVTTKKLSGK